MPPIHFRHKRVAIDFDGTLFEDTSSIDQTFQDKVDLSVKSQASESTKWLKKKGFEILIFTCRPDYHRKYLEQQMKKNEISFDYILFYTKPRVDLYIDDKGFRFENWTETKKWIQERLCHQEGVISSQQPESNHEKLLRKEKIKYLDIQNKVILDIGGGDGDVWDGLDINSTTIDLVEPDKNLMKKARAKNIYRNFYNKIEEVDIKKYDSVTILGVLEHIEDDRAFMEQVKDARSVYMTVPNANSFHRYFGKNMGILQDLTQLQEHDFAVGHKRYYTYESFFTFIRQFCKKNAFTISSFGTTSFKISSNSEMKIFSDRISSLNNTAEQLGIIGKNKEYGAEIFAFLKK